MNTEKKERLEHAIMEAVASYIATISNRTSLITPTNVMMSNSMSRATVHISVYPETQEKAAIDFLGRNTDNVREYIKKSVSLRRIPSIFFEIDHGEKNRQRIDGLLLDS